MTQGRAQRHVIKLGGTRDGRILAYHLDVIQDTGAYPRMTGFLAFLTSLMAAGAYDIPKVQTAARTVVTNTTPISAYRGAGRPEATAAIERAVDLFAAEIGMDPAEVRRINVVAADKFPFQSPSGPLYDSGDYVSALDKVLAGAGYQELRAEQAARRERGDTVALGIGLSSYVEITASTTPHPAAGPAFDVHDDGTATVYTGSSAHGPGSTTMMGHAGRVRAWHSDGQGHRYSRRHRPDPAGRRYLRVQVAAAWRRGRAEGRLGGQGPGQGGRRRHDGGQRGRPRAGR